LEGTIFIYFNDKPKEEQKITRAYVEMKGRRKNEIL